MEKHDCHLLNLQRAGRKKTEWYKGGGSLGDTSRCWHGSEGEPSGMKMRIVLPSGRRLEGLRERKVRELCWREGIPTKTCTSSRARNSRSPRPADPGRAGSREGTADR